MNEIPLVWVEVGRKIPKYLVSNIQLHREMYPSRPQILITDCPTPRVLDKDCEVVTISNLSEEFSIETTMKRTTGQEKFWINTTKRFFFLQEYLKNTKVKKLIHSESDNIILRADVIDNCFESSNWGLAYTMQANNVGCASIFLVNKESTLADFVRMIIDSWNKLDQDDMKLLGKFSTNGDVRILPTKVNDEFVFDAGTYGKFLLGTDARNRRFPVSSRGIVDDRIGAIDVWGEHLGFEYFDLSNRLLIDSASRTSELVNIHVHSKRIPSSLNKLRKIVYRDVNNLGKNLWFVGHLDSLVLLERFLSWVFRNILRRQKEVRLR